MKDSGVSVEEVGQLINDFQQTLFSIGGIIASFASKGEAEEFETLDEEPSIC